VQLEPAAPREHRSKREPTIPGSRHLHFGACADAELRDDGHLVPAGEVLQTEVNANEEERPDDSKQIENPSRECGSATARRAGRCRVWKCKQLGVASDHEGRTGCHDWRRE
jgi:hypothetical protein